jgi:hypothetical protein
VHSMWGPLSRQGYRLARAHLTGPRIVMSAVSRVAADAVADAL